VRPKKIILCVDSNELRLSLLGFMLSTNGYRVLPAASGDEAIALFSDVLPDLVIADFEQDQRDRVVARLKQIASYVPMILLGDLKKMEAQLHRADAALDRNGSHQWLLERIKVMAARKRGPRKGTPSPLRKAPVSVGAVELDQAVTTGRVA
jgi:DNA-binding response OmpR family regulator